jgi:glucose/arabinose dehydrogenase
MGMRVNERLRAERKTMTTSLASGAVIIAAGLALATCDAPGASTATVTAPFDVTTLATGLATPWDLAWGPDSMIWVSERGGRISRVDPNSGNRTVAGRIDVRESGESGLMGIAFDPSFAASPFVYAMHSDDAGGSIGNRLVRMRWNGRALGAPEVLLDGIVGAGIHDGSRIAVGPDKLLYVSTGDAGRSEHAQNRESLNGKILRLTLDGHAAPGNPFGDRIWSYGHRNPQGLVFHPTTGVLYETEHGPSDNDEINVITRGANYGWPDVHGKCDDDAERAFCASHGVVEALWTWTPTIAPTGADFYMSDRIPGWKGSLLFTALSGALYRATLSADGKSITNMEKMLAGEYGRLRDVLVGPGGEIYIATSNRDGRGSPRAGDDRILKLVPR